MARRTSSWVLHLCVELAKTPTGKGPFAQTDGLAAPLSRARWVATVALSSNSHGRTAIMGCMRVLVVEDNDAMADALQRGLIAEGFEVDVATNGVDGLWRAREFPCDVILLDIMLPGVNGYELCRTLRAEGNKTPILMVTAKDGEYDIAEDLDLGADDYLTKPFSFVVLVARIQALLRRANPSPGEAVITIGALSIDTMAQRCCVDAQAVDLTRREHALLETLARRPGEPLTRGELLAHVWGADHDAASNVVDVYVGYLRKKLQSKSARPHLIQTVRGIGYRIVEPWPPDSGSEPV